MKVIGIGGPAGAGKSAVAEFLARDPGIARVDLDRVAWGLYRPKGAVYTRLIARFGVRITDASGKINRGELGRIVFSDAKALADLDAIVHPAVGTALQEIIADKRAHGTKVLLVEGALLGLSPYVDYSLFDAVIWLSTPRGVRKTRLARAGREEHADRVPDHPTQPGVISVNGAGTICDTANKVRGIIAQLGEHPMGAQDR